MEPITGIHAVRAALAAGRPLERILIARGRHGARIEEIVRLARLRRVPVRFEERGRVDRLAAMLQHQGVVALAAPKSAVALEHLLKAKGGAPASAGRGQPAALLVLLDGVQDPHNLGAVARTALAAGADGLVVPERRAAGLTETAARVSAGALEHLPVARVTNVARAMEQLKENGYWLVGLDERATTPYTEADFTGPVGIVLGSEGKGLHELVRKRCDFLVSIPTTGLMRWLNVSVAAGVVLFEAVRQRAARKAPANSDE
jgi:23S rRNA (guanosine2251-2'-O)-methyltransferase